MNLSDIPLANVARLDFALGPVLITSEDLIHTLAGDVLMPCGARWAMIWKLIKPRVP